MKIKTVGRHAGKNHGIAESVPETSMQTGITIAQSDPLNFVLHDTRTKLMTRSLGQDSRRFSFLCVWLGALVLVCIGCGQGPSNRASVAGKVTVEGKPLEEGSSVFVPTEDTAGPTAGGRILNGSYSIGAQKGPVVGTARVEIRAVRETGKISTYGFDAGQKERVQYIPARYNDDSQLRADLKRGRNSIDFELTESE